MAKTPNLNTVAARDKLKPRREPYWHRLDEGRYLGFRRMSATAPGTWIARLRDDAGKQHYQALGGFEDLPQSKRFDAARAAAAAWFIGQGDATGATVADACNRYLAHIATTKSPDAAEDQRLRFFRRLIDGDPLATVLLRDLKRVDVEGWVSRQNSDGRKARATVSRDFVPLRAALNFAHDANLIGDDDAWRVTLRKLPGPVGRREHYLTPEDRRALVAGADEVLRPFLRLLCAIPLRPGAAAALRVRDFDQMRAVLQIGNDKGHSPRKIPVPPATAEFIAGLCASREPDAPLCCDSQGRAWTVRTWGDGVRAAVAAAGLPAGVSAYHLRHATITDLLTGGLDPMTTARLAGTSISQIQATYGHLLATTATAALAGLAF